MLSSVPSLDEKTFKLEVESVRPLPPILIDFWAEWCMPCRALSPVIDELSVEFAGKVRFAKVNVDECSALAARLGIRGIPTLLLFHQGKRVGELIGNQAKEKVRAFLTSVLNNS